MTHSIVVGDRDYFDTLDRLTCHQLIAGRGECGAQVALPANGLPPHRCPFGHYMPLFGSALMRNDHHEGE